MFSEEKNLQLAPGDEKELALFCSEVKRVDSGSQLLLEALFFSSLSASKKDQPWLMMKLDAVTFPEPRPASHLPALCFPLVVIRLCLAFDLCKSRKGIYV